MQRPTSIFDRPDSFLGWHCTFLHCISCSITCFEQIYFCFLYFLLVSGFFFGAPRRTRKHVLLLLLLLRFLHNLIHVALTNTSRWPAHSYEWRLLNARRPWQQNVEENAPESVFFELFLVSNIDVRTLETNQNTNSKDERNKKERMNSAYTYSQRAKKHKMEMD